MSRHGGFASIIRALAREGARQQRLAETKKRAVFKEQARAQRYAELAVREEEKRRQRDQLDFRRTSKQKEQEARAEYISEREQEALEATLSAAEHLYGICRILTDTLSIDDAIAFDSLRVTEVSPRLVVPENIASPKRIPQREDFLLAVQQPSALRKLLPGVTRSYAAALQDAERQYQQALALWQSDEKGRQAQIEFFDTEYDRQCKALSEKTARRNADIEIFRRSYHDGHSDSIVAYCSMVLERSTYPDGFIQKFSVGYSIDSKQLVVEYELPDAGIIPENIEFKYSKSRDEIVGKARKPADVRELYSEMIAAVALRTLHEIFEADQGDHIQVCCFNGYVSTVDRATGKDIRPHLISVRTTKEVFLGIDLARVDKKICLRNLGAQVTRGSIEAQPVKPLVEFNMLDARFVDQNDLVSSLGAATNLMDLNPWEFEQLVANLFGQMGLESKLTRSSRDGGVDCVAYDPRPVLGGKVVIQAKRYRHTVGVSAVRDLYGTMMNEGANKGILVTTSGYGPDAFQFSRDKPIELIDGGGLLFLLQEIGTVARIVFPEE